MKTALVVGAGPAGLMAAETLADAGLKVTVAEAKPSPARKLLMAGKSGLNITKNESFDQFMATFTDTPTALKTALEAFGPTDAIGWAENLGQDVFTGSTGRVFPKSMKASPLLRAWLHRLERKGVELKLGWKWVGWDKDNSQFSVGSELHSEPADVTVLACGGGSWARLGSDGSWVKGINAPVAPFEPANVGFRVAWSAHMERHFGRPVKPVGLRVDGEVYRGEIVVTKAGFEGGGIYTVSSQLRNGASLQLDFLPDLTTEQVEKRLSRPKGKESTSTYLKKTLGLSPVKVALLQEFSRPLPTGRELIKRLKFLEIPLEGPMPIDEAISTAGGLKFDSMTQDLMLENRAGVFCAGEMLDWEAPTGGYLITASLATGKLAGEAAAKWCESN